MTRHLYSEDAMIEQPAIELFKSIGYRHENGFFEKIGEYGTFGRKTQSEVILRTPLKDALIKLNPEIPLSIIDLAIEDLNKDRSTLNPIVANQEIYKMIKEGIKVSISLDDDCEEIETIKVIDFENPDNNDFLLVNQFWVTGEMYKRRADLIGFINGIPLIFIELKATHKKLKNAYDDNLTDYRDTIPQLFWYNAVIILSNGSDSKIGTISSEWEHFSDWKKISDEEEEGVISLDTMIRGTCQKERFLDLLENFVLFKDSGSLIKIIGKNHQYIGVNNAIKSFKQINENQGKLGVFWHTQGSGKSFSMIFFSQKILRKFHGNFTFLIVTDRKELDEQIYINFASVGAVIEEEVHAKSAKHLQKLLKENHRNIFTLIHKFRTDEGEVYPVLSERSDIIVITDEAHRSQYDTLAMNMRTALPKAAFIAFTGTPLMVGEELTKKTFGDYVSIYNFKQSIDDKATVPLYYENRIPEVQLKNEDLNQDLENIIEEALLDEDQIKKLEREFAREYHLITRNDRLERVAEDIVDHFIGRGYQGKAMVVSIDKPTAVKMYDKVQKYWNMRIEQFFDDLKKTTDHQEKETLEEKIKFLTETDMAVVVSGEQNEVKKFKNLGLDIYNHRKRMVDEDLATKFKDADDPFRMVFVCAMWMTGFDVPSLSTIYLDKPMRNHTLMQTIARANRVFEGKMNGLIVDYIGVFRDLKKALAIYGTSSNVDSEGEIPVKPKSELIKELKEAIIEIESFCSHKGIITQKIIDSEGFKKVKLLGDAVDAILVSSDSKKKYLILESNVRKLFKSILPDPDAAKCNELVTLFRVMSEKIRSIGPDTDITDVMRDIEELLDNSIESQGYIINQKTKTIDLSQIDFDALKKHFDKGRKHIKAEKLKNELSRKVITMVKLNQTRIDFLEKFQIIIDKYNSGAVNIESFFDELMEFAKDLNEEDKRSLSENLTEEELTIFDLLYKENLKLKEKNQVKKTAKHLLNVLKDEKLVLDWRKKQQTRADVLFTIEKILDECLPRSYTPEIYEEKCNFVYQHVYDSYYGVGESLYSKIGIS